MDALLLLSVRILALPAILLIGSGAREAPGGPEVAGQTFVFVNGAEFLVASVRLLRTAHGGVPAPRRVGSAVGGTISVSPNGI